MVAKTKKQLQKLQLKYNRYLVNKFFNNLETRGGIVGDKAVLFVYDSTCPELSYILTEQL